MGKPLNLRCLSRCQHDDEVHLRCAALAVLGIFEPFLGDLCCFSCNYRQSGSLCWVIPEGPTFRERAASTSSLSPGPKGAFAQ